MVGLAAPQVGIPLQIILVDMYSSREKEEFSRSLEVFINPVITWKSEVMVDGFEGCYSTGYLMGIVPRHREITIEAFTRDGEKIEMALTDFTARVFQHEVDHLNGFRFQDRMEDFSKLHLVKPEERESYRKEYKSWESTFSKADWEEFIKVK